MVPSPLTSTVPFSAVAVVVTVPSVSVAAKVILGQQRTERLKLREMAPSLTRRMETITVKTPSQ
jgi:hypothetical protein